ncbi:MULTISPECIES: STAS domain-containing protein [unclassified Amycolatopsis]|uniref:STAS domain-containing protein n=1 Tax=unclassified Amycolatopsis TaxID=2618356 RepID=UPI0028741DA3|nr:MULTISPECIES: STAS domain-containing protein [unclassified Amycolatopsis]MDS0139256.1 STAS domain-containing protein [Amycolatopsis sp. 505]MDS0144488.1 STAS domain-containing protein [Amycolatopsis sp. CM201R]
MTTCHQTLPTVSGAVEPPDALHLTTHRPAPGTAVVEAAGDLDLATAPRLRELIATTATSTPAHLVIDLRGVQFLSATGLAAVEHGYLLATGRGITCTVRVDPAGRVLRVIRLLPWRFAEAVEAA